MKKQILLDQPKKIYDFNDQNSLDACSVGNASLSLVDTPHYFRGGGSRVAQLVTDSVSTNGFLYVPLDYTPGGHRLILWKIAKPGGQSEAVMNMFGSIVDTIPLPVTTFRNGFNPQNPGFYDDRWVDQVYDLYSQVSGTPDGNENLFYHYFALNQFQTSKTFFIDSIYSINPNPPPIVLVADDSVASFFTLGNPIRRQYNIPFSHAVLWSQVGGSAVSEAQLGDYLVYGDELNLHAELNYGVVGLSAWLADIDSQLAIARDFKRRVSNGEVLDTSGNVVPRWLAENIRLEFFCYPGGSFDFDVTTAPLKERGVLSARQVSASLGSPNNHSYVYPSDQELFSWTAFEPQSPYTSSLRQAHVNDAVARFDNPIFETYHIITAGSAIPSQANSMNEVEFDLDMSFYRTGINNNDFRVCTFSQMYEQLMGLGGDSGLGSSISKRILR